MTVQDIRTILRLAHQQGLSIREIGLRLKLSKTTVATYLYRAREARLNCWPLPPGRDDDATLEAALFQRVGRPPRDLEGPDWAKVATELKRKGVTLVLLWQEYRAAHPDGYGCTWFCEEFRAFENRTSPSFSNRHEAGAVMQTDYAGHTIPIGGATADSCNRLSINAPAMLFNNAGAAIEATVTKAAPANDAAFAFKAGFSARALIGLLGSDDFSFKVSPDGSAFYEAIRIDSTNGQVELPQPTILPGLSAAPSPPPTGKAAVYARNRAGAPWIDVMRPSGRDFPLQPHFGVNRIANWSPSVTTTITTEGLPITSVGTVSTPTLAATNLAASMRRWRLTSAAVVDSAAEQRSAGWACWRGNAAGLGGWTFVTRISLTTLQATGMGFFGLYGSTAALATTLTLATAINCIGIGFQRGTHTRWQLVTNDSTGAPTLTDMGASFGIATGGVLTLFIAAPPNGGSVWVRVVDEVSGAVFEQEITADLPANSQFLSPRLFMNNGATAAAVAYDCSGVYVETDY